MPLQTILCAKVNFCHSVNRDLRFDCDIKFIPLMCDFILRLNTLYCSTKSFIWYTITSRLKFRITLYFDIKSYFARGMWFIQNDRPLWCSCFHVNFNISIGIQHNIMQWYHKLFCYWILIPSQWHPFDIPVFNFDILGDFLKHGLDIYGFWFF